MNPDASVGDAHSSANRKTSKAGEGYADYRSCHFQKT